MKTRIVPGTPLLHSPFLSLGLIIILLILSVSYWSVSNQNKSLHSRNQKQQKINDQIEKQLVDSNNLLKTAETELGEHNYHKENLEKCLREKTKLEAKDEFKANSSENRMEDLLAKIAHFESETAKLKQELNQTKEQLKVKEERNAVLGKSIVQLRSQLEAGKDQEKKDVAKAILLSETENKTVSLS